MTDASAAAYGVYLRLGMRAARTKHPANADLLRNQADLLLWSLRLAWDIRERRFWAVRRRDILTEVRFNLWFAARAALDA